MARLVCTERGHTAPVSFVAEGMHIQRDKSSGGGGIRRHAGQVPLARPRFDVQPTSSILSRKFCENVECADSEGVRMRQALH